MSWQANAGWQGRAGWQGYGGWTGVSGWGGEPSSGTTTPVLDLTFLTASLDGRITFTRGSGGTRVNSSGNIVTETNDVARFDYNPSTLAARGLLLEPARTNLVIQNQDFSQAAWNKTNVTIGGSVTLPTGSTGTVNKLIETTANSTHGCDPGTALTIPASSTITISAYFKSAERGFGHIQWNNAGDTAAAWTSVNLSTGAVTQAPTMIVGTFTNMTSRVENAGNGWWRLIFTLTMDAVANGKPFMGVSTDGTTRSYTGVATNGIFCWGVQVEVGGNATSVLLTTTASVARSADSAVMTSTNFSTWFNSAVRGTLYASFERDATGTGCHAVAIRNAAEADRIFIAGGSGTPASQRFDVNDNAGASQAQITLSASVATNTIYKAAGSFKTNEFRGAWQGVAQTADTAGTVPTDCDRLRISQTAMTGPMRVRTIQFYSGNMSDAQLATLTT